MLPILTEKGVPGAAGAVLTDAGGTAYFASCHHVLFGHGGARGDRVWMVLGDLWAREHVELGRTSHGVCGRVTHAGRTCFVDCAVGELSDALPAAVRRSLAAAPTATGVARVSQRVHKDAAITGRTEGVVVDDAHSELPTFDGEESPAPGQLLVRPDLEDHWFCAPGESGAALLDGHELLVGFLWGVNTAGDGIACPAVPALHHLGLEPADLRAEWR
jgi:hypothetical protein